MSNAHSVQARRAKPSIKINPDLGDYDHWIRKAVDTPEEKILIMAKALNEIARIGHEDGVERYIARAALMLTGELK